VSRRERWRERGVRVEVVADGPDGVDLRAALRALHANGVASLLVEGGARVITSLLAAGLVDRLLVGVAPLIIGTGTEAVGPLGVTRIADGIHLANRSVHAVGDDLLLAWDVAH
jgi:riboflavin biosynthesis pyrimidine reductase